MTRQICTVVFAAMVLYLSGRIVTASEPWADPRLPVSDGLALWLDAASQPLARAATSALPLADGGPLVEWLDASGNKRHVTSSGETTAPLWAIIQKHSGGDQDRVGAVVRFDGMDDHLRRAGIGAGLDEFTIFVVAAPHSNTGFFRGLFASNAKDTRDYQSGLTIDLHGTSSTQFDQCNIEGLGFGGATDLLNKAFPFGTLTVLEANGVPDGLVINLLVDGEWTGHRVWNPVRVAFDEITVGARYYTNDGGPQQPRGTLDGDIAEIIVYDRVLHRTEATNVQKYLQKKWEGVRERLPKTLGLDTGGALVTVADPPPVQMLLPGFEARQLPIDLPNINNIRYRADGKLVALAYNGDVMLLSDQDGDGLEETAKEFWLSNGSVRGPIGMALTPPDYPHGNGLIVASKGKISLIVDTDGDDDADEEIVIAQGWTELPHGVDALGVAIDPRDFSIFFGLGTADYTNAYLTDAQGASRYRLGGDRGTIQRLSADFSKREIYCTGIRFPVGLAFNENGDLFCTDQEGATWLPNGNPFDELLHVQSDRHYGFPPRHPKFLPDVIDEPSTFDYKPQHQSTCGLTFNLASQNGSIFGPESWRGDAIVCGYSRGKIYRTQLAQTDLGYVARSQLIACLNMLTVDAVVSPSGQLVVSTHTGAPDWGTGPQGKGKLYKITYKNDVPMPIHIWPVDKTTVCVAFDRELDPASLSGLGERCRITGGPYVQAGDQYEVLHPPYDAVQRQLQATRQNVPVHAVQLSPDRKQLLLTTAPHDVAYSYALSIADWQRPRRDEITEPLLPQYSTIEFAYDLTGIQVRELRLSDQTGWTGWLPFVELFISQGWLAGSASHESLWKQFSGFGEVTVSCQLDLQDMLRPKVQPGSQIDYQLPEERVTVVCSCNTPFFAEFGNQKASGQPGQRVEFSATTDWEMLSIKALHQENIPQFTVGYYTSDDPQVRVISPQRIFVPWARPADQESEAPPNEPIRLQLSGNWSRGKKIFFGDKAQCSKCHSGHDPGGKIGAPLGNLWHRDKESVLRDIRHPNFAINPDFITYNVQLNDGRVLTGVPRTEGDSLIIANQKGELTTIDADEVDVMQAAPLSTMPEGLLNDLNEQDVNDLLTYLLSPPPRMPLYAPNPPPPRSRAEVDAVLQGADERPAQLKPLHIALVSGPKDHGPGEHDYPAWRDAWTELFSAVEGVEVSTAEMWPDERQLKEADVLVFFQQGRWDEQRATDLDQFLSRGGGAVYLHYAVDGGSDPRGFAERIGLAWQGGASKFRHGALDIDFDAAASPEILRNFHRVHFEDESYWNLVGDGKRVTVLGTGMEDGQPQPLFWTAEPKQGGRVFASILGHYSWTFDDPLFRILVLRGVAWSAGEPVDRFSEVVTFGARVAD